MKIRQQLFNRIMLTSGLVNGLTQVWLQLQPNLITLILLAIFGVTAVMLADISLVLFDILTQPLAQEIATGAVSLLAIAPQIALGIAIVFAIGVVVHHQLKQPYCAQYSPPTTHTNFFAPTPDSPAFSLTNLFSAKHGAYKLHAITQSLLFYS